MAKLPTLKPRLSTVKSKPSIQTLDTGTKRNNGRAWRKFREKVLLRDQYTCQHCGLVSMKLEVDHIKPLADGGQDLCMQNSQSLCPDCHTLKTVKENSERAIVSLFR